MAVRGGLEHSQDATCKGDHELAMVLLNVFHLETFDSVLRMLENEIPHSSELQVRESINVLYVCIKQDSRTVQSRHLGIINVYW